MTAASFLLRFDDICPTMNWQVWDRIEPVLDHFGIRPIVAVVPANTDPELVVANPNPCFWQRVRDWQGKNWSIALHGCEHRYETKSSGIMRLNSRSEFAGLPRSNQEAKLRRALDLFRAQGIRPDSWVAPSHSFDWTTVHLLHELGVKIISDGLSRLPYRDRHGLLWVPQQLWRLKPARAGIWTVCYHHNVWDDKTLQIFRQNLETFHEQITTLEDVYVRYKHRRRDFADRVSELTRFLAIYAKAQIPRKLVADLCRT